jgi:hypothetical protein
MVRANMSGTPPGAVATMIFKGCVRAGESAAISPVEGTLAAAARVRTDLLDTRVVIERELLLVFMVASGVDCKK